MSIPAVLVSPYRDLPCALHAKLEPQAEDSPSTMGENLCASNMEDAHALNVEPDFAEREREKQRQRNSFGFGKMAGKTVFVQQHVEKD